MTRSRQQPVQNLLTPLAEFDQLHAATLRRHGHHAVDLSYPNPRVMVDARPYQALATLAARVGPDDLRYPPFGGFTTTRRRVAASLSQCHHLPYQLRDILMTPGATAALNLSLQTLFQPGDRIVVVTPCWMDYPLYLSHLGLTCDLVPADDGKHIDLAAIETAWTSRTRGIMISQPASPTGAIHTEGELAALTDTLLRLGTDHGHMPTLISDETHRDHIWATDRSFHTPLSSYRNAVSIYSFGKALQMQGQRTGYIAVHPDHPHREQLQQALTDRLRTTGTCGPTALMQHLAAELADHTPPLDALRALQQHARARLFRGGYDVIEGHAGPFIYARAPGGDACVFTKLLAERGVLVMPSEIFHEPGYFRIALNTSITPLERALDIITAVVAHG